MTLLASCLSVAELNDWLLLLPIFCFLKMVLWGVIPGDDPQRVGFCVKDPLVKWDHGWRREQKIEIFKRLGQEETLHHVIFDPTIHLCLLNFIHETFYRY